MLFASLFRSYKGRRRCPKTLQQMCYSAHFLNRIHTVDFYCGAKHTVIFHVYFLRERSHKMTSVHRRHSCLSVTPMPRCVLQMGGLCGWATLIPIGISEVQNRKKVSYLETKGGGLEALALRVNRCGLCWPWDFGVAQDVLNGIHQKLELHQRLIHSPVLKGWPWS